MRNIVNFILLTTVLALFPISAGAVPTPTKIPTDDLQIGKFGSTANKSYVFDFGLGASNPKLFSDNATKNLFFNKNSFTLGDGASSTKTFLADLGLGASNPKLNFDPAAGSWQFSNDGTNFTAIGSGSGGSGINLLTNGGFESGVTQDWTNTGGTFVSTSSSLIEKKSAVFTASAASQSFQSGLHAPLGLSGNSCVATFFYTGGDTNLSAEVLDDLSNVLAGPQVIQSATTMTQISLPFICPASPRTIRLKVLSSAASAAMTVDGAVLGQNTLFNISQATLVGGAVLTGCSSPWSSSGTSFAAYATQTSCVYTTFGSALAPATNVPGVRFSSLPPGEYILQYEGLLQANVASKVAYYQFSDGTNNAREISEAFSAAASGSSNGIFQSISYLTAQTNITLQVFSKNDSGGSNFILGQTGQPGVIKIYRFPTSSEQAVRADNINPWVDAYIADASNFALATSGTVTKGPIEDAGGSISANPGSQSVQIPCSSTNPSTGTTCAAGNESMGVVFNVPAAGVWTVCTDFSQSQGYSAGSVVAQNFYLVETPNNAQTILQGDDFSIDTSKSVPSTGTWSYANSFCRDFNFTSAGQKTIRFIYSQSSTGTISQNLILTDGTGDRRFHIRAFPKNVQTPTPVFPGSVYTSSTGREAIERVALDATAGVCSTGTCTILNKTPGVTSVTRFGTGNYSVNFAVGTFSSAPTCTCGAQSGGAISSPCASDQTSQSATVKHLFTSNSSAYIDTFFEVICMGPK